MHPFVSVIIPFYGDPAELDCCLKALDLQSYPHDRFEVIVVDNGSSAPPARDTRYHSHIRIIREPRAGSYRARNVGVQAAQGSTIAFTDSDCVPAPDWLERGVEHLAVILGNGLIGGRIVLTTHNPEQPTLLERYERETYLSQEFYIRSCHFAATANLFTNMQTFRAVGIFDGDLLSGGDMEWGKRMHAAGCAQCYAPDAVVFHPARSSVRAFIRKNRRIAGGEHEGIKKYPVCWGIVPYRSNGMRALRRDIQKLRARKEHGCLRWPLIGIAIAVWMFAIAEWIRLDLGGKPLRS